MRHHYKTHIRDIRLFNNGGLSVPVCKATAPLLDLASPYWEFAQDPKDATCKVCRSRYPRRYPWTKGATKGFTFIEFMVIAAIIGILGAIAIPNFLKWQEKRAAEKPAEDPRTEEQKAQDDWEVKKTFTLEGCQGYRFHIRAVGDKFLFVCPPGGNNIEVLP